MMESKIMGPTSNEWFKFGAIKEMSTTKESISLSNGSTTVTMKLANPDGEFVSLPEKYSGSNVSTVQRVKVESSKDEAGLREQVTTWELLFDDKHRETFTTRVKSKTPYNVLSNPLEWSTN